MLWWENSILRALEGWGGGGVGTGEIWGGGQEMGSLSEAEESLPKSLE